MEVWSYPDVPSYFSPLVNPNSVGVLFYSGCLDVVFGGVVGFFDWLIKLSGRGLGFGLVVWGIGGWGVDKCVWKLSWENSLLQNCQKTLVGSVDYEVGIAV
jgi:hypothetical protein